MPSKSPRQVTVTVSAEVYAALDRRAARSGMNVARYLSDFLDEYSRNEWLDDETPQERAVRKRSIRGLERAVRTYDRPVRVRPHLRGRLFTLLPSHSTTRKRRSR